MDRLTYFSTHDTDIVEDFEDDIFNHTNRKLKKHKTRFDDSTPAERRKKSKRGQHSR